MSPHCRRLSRLTNAFSNEFENFKAAVVLHYGYNNLVKFNSSIRCTLAMAMTSKNLPGLCSEVVVETFKGEVVWQGTVEVLAVPQTAPTLGAILRAMKSAI